MVGRMLEGLGPALQDHLMRAVLVSGVIALVLTAGAAVLWWRGRRWTKNRSSSPWAPTRDLVAFSRTGGSGGSPGGGDPQPETDRRTGDDQLGSRLIRDAAARAAALREAWDRSYREAREPRADESTAPSAEISGLLQEVLREQRETNSLLRELVAGMRQPRD